MQGRAVPLLLDKPWFLRVSVPLWQISSSNESWGTNRGSRYSPSSNVQLSIVNPFSEEESKAQTRERLEAEERRDRSGRRRGES